MRSILESLVGCAMLALPIIGSASIIGARYEKYAILGEVYPNWPRQLNLLWRNWNVRLLLRDHEAICSRVPGQSALRHRAGRVIGAERANSLMRYVCGARGRWDHLVLWLDRAFCRTS